MDRESGRTVAPASVFLFLFAATIAGCERAPGPPPSRTAAAEFAPRNLDTEVHRIRVTRVAGGLEHPWSIAFLPDGRYLVTERAGRLNLITPDGSITPISELPPLVYRHQGGLFDITLHPDYESNGWIYISYARGNWRGSESWLTVIRARLDGHRLSDVERIFSQDHSNFPGMHYGARMAWLPDGTLLLTVGDRQTQVELAQDSSHHTGSILRLTDGGGAPDDNPLVGTQGARPEIYSWGHRNPQGLVVDPGNGQIWATEHGPLGGDELNLIQPGRNYGWPIVSRGRHYDTGEPFGEARSLSGMEDPVYEFPPTLAPSGLAMVTSPRFPGWRGNLLAGGLRGVQLRRLVLEDGKVVHDEQMLTGEIGRIRDVREGPDGHIYLLTDHEDGALYRIEAVDDTVE